MTMKIGIDPDLVKSGVAVAVDGSLLTLDGLPFFELIKFIDEHKHQALFVLEDVEHDRAVYHRGGASRLVMLNIAQKVGQVKAIGRLIKQYLEGAGADYVMVKPLQGHLKKAKKDAAFFNQLTGWDGKSNEDKRDAGVLALYGEKSRAMRLG